MKATRAAAALLLATAAAARGQSEGVAQLKGSMAFGAGRTVSSAGKVYFSAAAYRLELEVDMSAVLPKATGSAGTTPAVRRTITIQKFSDPDHSLQLNEDRRTYAISDWKALREGQAGRPQPTYTVKKLGRDTIAGHACQKALVTSSSGTESELCVANDLVAPPSWPSSLGRKEASGNMLAALRSNGLPGFPIRMVVRGADQSIVSTMELVRFDKKALPASLFEVPTGYTRTDEASLNLTPEQEKMMKELREKMKSRNRS